MKKLYHILYLIFIALTSTVTTILVMTTPVHAQYNNSQLVSKVWTHITGNPGDTLNWTNQVLDAARNLIIIGNNLQNNQTTDMLLTKYKSSDGSVMWQVQYDNSGNNDFGISVVCDPSKNIYTATTSYINSTNGYDWVIQKYDSNGTVQWTKTYSSGFYDVPTDMKYDGIGNLYVTGVRTTTTTLQDYCTIKYDAGNGNTLWASPAIYNYTNLIDIPAAITIGTTGRIIVAGGSGSTLTNWDFATIRYSPSTGSQVNVTRNPSNGLGFDQPTSIAKDQYDNIYVTGYSAITGNGYDIKIVKLDTALSLLWSVTYDGGDHLNDGGNSIGVDATGNVYVTGYTTKTNGGTDIVTLKYNNSGTLQWSKKYSAPDPTKTAIAKKLDIDPYGNILIVGDAYNIGNRDILSIAYDVNGKKKWEEWFNGSGNGDDVASALKIDDATNYFYVTGKVWTGTQYQYATTKYQMIDYITPPDTEKCPNSFAYYENKGQIIDDIGAVRNDLPYYCQSDDPQLYFSSNKVSFQYDKHLIDPVITDSSFRFEMQFQSGVTSKIYSADPAIPGYLNYFKPQCASGAILIKGRQYLLMKSIYRNIDVLYHGNSKGLKMYFNCYPGSTPSGIVLNFAGATSVSIVSGTLKIATPLGMVTFIAPEAYQIDTNGNKVSVGFTPAYATAGTNKISFTLGTYNTALPLVIQMQKNHSPQNTDDCGGNCTWSSFYEGTNTEFKNVRSGSDGTIYVVGQTGDNTFKSTNGVIKTSSGGLSDAVALKFNNAGVRQWATYFGGSKDENGFGIDVDASSNVYFTGSTTSSDFSSLTADPGGSAYYQNTIGSTGIPDAFIAKLNSLGSIPVWVTFYGGSGSESGNDLRIDLSGNVYIAGSGDANTPHLSLGGGYNNSTGKGLLAKFTLAGVREWATALGTTGSGAIATALDADKNSSVYVVGTATGDGLPTAGAYANTTFRGGTFDGFATAFNSSGAIAWCTYIGGDLYDQARDCAIYYDQFPENPIYLFVTGAANSTENTFLPLAYSGGQYFDNSHTGTQNAFITQYDCAVGQSAWSTFYGNADIDLGQGVTTDIDNRVYVTGFTEATSLDLPTVDPNKFYFDNTNSNTDAFLLCFDRYRQLIWGTYFGGGDNDFGNALATYKNEKLYMVGKTNSTTAFPLDDGLGTPYYYPTGNFSGEGFITRFDLTISFVGIQNLITDESVIKVYPNPSNGEFKLFFDLPLSEKCHLLIRNITGEVVKDLGEYSSIIQENKINISNLPKGIYLLQIEGSQSNLVSKIIIQ